MPVNAAVCAASQHITNLYTRTNGVFVLELRLCSRQSSRLDSSFGLLAPLGRDREYTLSPSRLSYYLDSRTNIGRGIEPFALGDDVSDYVESRERVTRYPKLTSILITRPKEMAHLVYWHRSSDDGTGWIPRAIFLNLVVRLLFRIVSVVFISRCARAERTSSFSSPISSSSHSSLCLEPSVQLSKCLSTSDSSLSQPLWHPPPFTRTLAQYSLGRSALWRRLCRSPTR